jgi:hypothetical protein
VLWSTASAPRGAYDGFKTGLSSPLPFPVRPSGLAILTRRSTMSATTAHQPANVVVGFGVVAVVLLAYTRAHLGHGREDLD